MSPPTLLLVHLSTHPPTRPPTLSLIHQQLTLQELQGATSPSFVADNWDDASITMLLKSSTAASSPGLRLPLVKGSPYITAEVPAAAKPILRAPGNGGGTLTSISQPAANKLRIVVGSVPADGTHTWLLWASKPITYSQSGGSISIAGTDSGGIGTFTGVLRMAWVPNAGTANAAAMESMLDQYVGTYPIGGSVNAWSYLAAATASYSLSWATKSMSGAGSAAASSPLLMLALPHHIDTLVSPTARVAAAPTSFPLGVSAAGAGSSGLVYTSQPAAASGRTSLDFGAYVMTVRGPQVPVVGSCWLLQEQVLPVGLGSETQAAANLKNTAWRADIEQTLLVSLAWGCICWACFFCCLGVFSVFQKVAVAAAA